MSDRRNQSGDRRRLRGTARLGFHGQRRAPPKNSALTAASAERKLSPAWATTVKFEREFGAGAQTYTGTGVLHYAARPRPLARTSSR
jgi:hypothetical protein